MKVDLVYLWVDGNDPEWLSRRAPYLAHEDMGDRETFCEGRTTDNDELRYSLRSVDMYAKWVNHIYIVTDRQTPKWLNIDNPKVTIVDHTSIFEEQYLPLYNSFAIELGIHRIEGLSEYYIYANDDMMFGRSVAQDFFVSPQGRMRCRFNLSPMSPISTYDYTVAQASRAISNDFGLECCAWSPHHQIDIYQKSVVAECIARYQSWVDRTLRHRFRDDADIERHIFSLYAVATSGAEAVVARRSSPLRRVLERVAILLGVRKGDDSKVVSLSQRFVNLQIFISRPALLCFNDSEGVTSEDRGRLKGLLARLYPNSSQFER